MDMGNERGIPFGGGRLEGRGRRGRRRDISIFLVGQQISDFTHDLRTQPTDSVLVYCT